MKKENENINETIGKRIKIFRERLGWTQTFLAEKAGVAQSSISAAENSSEDTHIYVDTLLRIAKALDVPVNYFFQSFNDLDLAADNSDNPDFDEDNALAQSLIYRNIVAAFYPPPLTATYVHQKAPVFNLMQFLVYLPLMEPTILWQQMHAIMGDYVGNERYIGKALGDIVSLIPDSPAKKYADIISSYIGEITTGENWMDVLNRIHARFDESEEFSSLLDAYLEVININ